MIIREIQPSDNSQIASVIRQVFISDNYPKTGTAFEDVQLDFMYETYQALNSAYFVLIDTDENSPHNGKIVGGAGLSKLDNSDENICELQKMYFLKDTRGKGFGLKMILECLQKATAFGYDKCYLETLPEMIGAQELYKKVGFEYIESPLGGTGHTSCPVWMIKNLK